MQLLDLKKPYQICVTSTAPSCLQTKRDIDEATKRNANLLEIRGDLWEIPPTARDLEDLVRYSPLPLILTCRGTEEKGSWKGTEAERRAVLQNGCYAGVSIIDNEHRHHHAFEKRLTLLLESAHYFEGTPRDMYTNAAALAQSPGIDIIKYATMAQRLEDNAIVLETMRTFKRAHGIPTVAVCMGSLGADQKHGARVWGPVPLEKGGGGGAWTYCTLKVDKLGVGQITPEEMRQIWKEQKLLK
jgi:3-dehydroquinate dehydratase type I